MKKNMMLFLLATALCFVLSILLSQCYLFAEKNVSSAWMAAAVTNSIFAFIAYALWKLLAPPQQRAGLIFYLPALVIVFGSLGLALFTHFKGFSQRMPEAISFKQMAWILWIPIVEEWVFRMGIGSITKKMTGSIAGIYLSALTFSYIHSFPTILRVFEGHTGLFLGPFILGIICELLILFSRSVRPAIAFHMACNATVVIFGWVDSRWLNWLKILYT